MNETFVRKYLNNTNPLGHVSDLATMHVEVRTRGDAMSMLPEIRKAVAAMYPEVALEKPMTQQASLMSRTSNKECLVRWEDSLAFSRRCW